MNYIYDILINLNSKCYEFYEWNNSDKIVNLRKIPIIKISTNTFNEIKNNVIKLDKDELMKIGGKTEFFSKRNSFKYGALYTDEKSSVVIIYDNKGISKYKSALIIEEENDSINMAKRLKESIIKYQLIKEDRIPIFISREELIKKNKYKKYLSCLANNNEYDKIKYLYLEIFNQESIGDSESYSQIVKEIDFNFNKISTILDGFFNIIKIGK